MTPKEKAVEIFNKMCNEVDELLPLDIKECALIAINEVILANPHSNPLNTDVYSTMDYWQEVKREIEKL